MARKLNKVDKENVKKIVSEAAGVSLSDKHIDSIETKLKELDSTKQQLIINVVVVQQESNTSKTHEEKVDTLTSSVIAILGVGSAISLISWALSGLAVSSGLLMALSVTAVVVTLISIIAIFLGFRIKDIAKVFE